MAPLLLIGAALGGTAMYFFDPDRGRRRRALVRDRAVKTSRRTAGMFEAGTRDLANRAAAVPHRLHAALHHHDSVPDSVLAERVRAKMGRYVSHPGATKARGEFPSCRVGASGAASAWSSSRTTGRRARGC